MCYLCLESFEFELPIEEPILEQKKKRLLKIKSLLSLAVELTLCEDAVEELKAEQYILSREF